MSRTSKKRRSTTGEATPAAGPPSCPYCGAGADLVDGTIIYPHRPDLAALPFWSCAPCRAYVGCHPGTKRPLGRLADEPLRKAKSRAHAVFDPLWRGGGMGRREAYAWLAEQLQVPAEECHIGMFDLERCKATVEACRARGRASS